MNVAPRDLQRMTLGGENLKGGNKRGVECITTSSI